MIIKIKYSKNRTEHEFPQTQYKFQLIELSDN